MNLLTLSSADASRYDIEKIFFGDIDDKGARVRDQLLDTEVSRFTVDQRCDFARLLISLDARRPNVVNKLLRKDGSSDLKEEIDCDPALAQLVSHGEDIVWRVIDDYAQMTQAPIVGNFEYGRYGHAAKAWRRAARLDVHGVRRPSADAYRQTGRGHDDRRR